MTRIRVLTDNTMAKESFVLLSTSAARRYKNVAAIKQMKSGNFTAIADCQRICGWIMRQVTIYHEGAQSCQHVVLKVSLVI